MFSRFKKPDATDPKPAPAAGQRPVAPVAPPAGQPSAAPRPSLAARPVSTQPSAEALAADKEKKRKDRLMELKVELHKKLLESLNLRARLHWQTLAWLTKYSSKSSRLARGTNWPRPAQTFSAL